MIGERACKRGDGWQLRAFKDIIQLCDTQTCVHWLDVLLKLVAPARDTLKTREDLASHEHIHLGA